MIWFVDVDRCCILVIVGMFCVCGVVICGGGVVVIVW